MNTPSRNIMPRLSIESDERLTISLSAQDDEMIMQSRLEHGKDWFGVVTDLNTGRKWMVEGAECSLGCHCDSAIAHEVLTLEVSPAQLAMLRDAIDIIQPDGEDDDVDPRDHEILTTKLHSMVAKQEAGQ